MCVFTFLRPPLLTLPALTMSLRSFPTVRDTSPWQDVGSAHRGSWTAEDISSRSWSTPGAEWSVESVGYHRVTLESEIHRKLTVAKTRPRKKRLELPAPVNRAPCAESLILFLR